MKQQDIAQLSVEDVKSKLLVLEEKLDNMKLSHSVSPLENPLQIKSTRREIARLKTELTKRNKQAAEA